jgi:proteasome lid subunit RPN8/RPN11
MSTIIDKDILKAIQHQLEENYPDEGCGFLFGSESDRSRHITARVAAENTSQENHRRRFVIAPLDYLNAERWAQQQGLQLLGIYHSHPDHPAVPSDNDLEFAQPYFSYFIHAIENGKLTSTRSYRLINGQFVEEKFTIHQIIKTP